jgi:hypothetical protein
MISNPPRSNCDRLRSAEMSFIPSTSGPSQIQADLAQQREQELEAKAERYAQLHPEGEDQVRSPPA